ncbi:unnamed protein product [Cladocopium goreaui]|uniref:EF-hand domain-containing protein n=1 Tax=Cladocopium goreaui TaxID=2562237 RepID=A0A9P1M3X5_9DINO|nr:unnamed protein product [Cladocopium goreaui]
MAIAMTNLTPLASGVGTPLIWLCTQVESLQRLVVGLLTRVADLEREVAPMKNHIVGGGCVQPGWRQSKDEDVDGLKDAVTKLMTLVQRLEYRLPPPLVERRDCHDVPSEERGMFDDAEELFLKSPLAAPAANQLELQGLLYAVAFGEEAEALMLINSADALNSEAKVQLDVKDSTGRTALHCAASRGSQAVTRMLLDHSNFVRYINSPDRYLRTALHMAARAGHADLCRLLLNHRLFTSASAVDCDGQTALHHAAAAGHEEVCAALLEHSEFTVRDTLDCFGRMALHYAARGGHQEVAEVLLKDVSDLNEVWAQDCDCLTPLHCAAFRGHAAFCEKILSHSSFAEMCRGGNLNLSMLPHVQDDVRLVFKRALEDVGLSLPPLDANHHDSPKAVEENRIPVAEEDPAIEAIEARAPRSSSGTRDAPVGSVDAALKEIFSGSPLLAIHHQLQVANVTPLDYFNQLDQDSDGRLTLDELDKCLRSIGYKATFKELQELVSRLDRETDTVAIVALDRAVKLEAAEYEARRRRELEEAMRRATGLEMDDPNLEEVHPAILALLQHLKDSNIRVFALFRQHDQDGNGVWSAADLRNALQSAGYKIRDDDVETLMEMMDSDRNGFIDVKELARALHRAELRSSPSGQDAVIEVEFMDALQEITATAALVAIYERLELNKLRTAEFLELFDRNSDAYLTPAELQRGLQQIGYEISQQELDALVFLLDVDRVGMLSVKEFEHRVKKAALEALEAAKHRVADSPTDTSILDVLHKVNAGLRAGKMTVYGRKIHDGHGFFKAIDKDGSGSLDPAEVQRGFRRLGVDVSDHLLQQLTDAMDTNENGKIELAEFIRALHDPESVQKKFSMEAASLLPPASSQRGLSAVHGPARSSLKDAERSTPPRRSPFGPDSRRESMAARSLEGHGRTSLNPTAGRSSSPRTSGLGSLSNSPRPRTSLVQSKENTSVAADAGVSVDALGALRLIHQQMGKGQRTIDLFRQFDKSGDGSIGKSELRKGLEEMGVKIDPASFKALMGYLDRDSEATISLKELDRGIKEAIKKKDPKEDKIDRARWPEYELLKEINKALYSGTQIIFGNRVTDSRSFFRAIDKDNSGELDVAELARGLMKLGIMVDESLMKELVGCIDKNDSGLIDKEEFIKALQNPEELLAKPEEKKERRVIEAGSKEDATKALAKIHEQMSASRTRTTDWFYKMDTSRDGKISRAELKKGLKDMSCNLSASDLKAVLQYLDDDNSGSVSLQELQKGMNRAVREVAEAQAKLEPQVTGPATNAYEALVQINAALRSNTQMILGMRVTDGRSFFKAMDKDTSGSLDVAEVARGLKRLGLDVSEALLDDLVAAIDVNKNGLIEMKEFVHALKLPDDVADPKAAPAVASAPDPEPAAAEPDPQADPLPPEAAPAPPEANSASVEVEDTTMAGLAKRASQASRASQGSKGFQAQAQMVESLESPGVVEKVRSASRSPRGSALQALQDQSATQPGPEETPAEAPSAQEVASIREAAATRPEAAGTRPSVTPRKSQAKAASSSGGLLSRASKAVGAITGGSSTSASRRQTQRTTLNRGSPSPRPRSTTRGSTFR